MKFELVLEFAESTIWVAVGALLVIRLLPYILKRKDG